MISRDGEYRKAVMRSSLTPTQRWVLVCLLEFADWGTLDGARPSVATLAERTGYERRAVRRVLKQLEGLGWIACTGMVAQVRKWKLAYGQPRILDPIPDTRSADPGSDTGSTDPGSRIPDRIEDPVPDRGSADRGSDTGSCAPGSRIPHRIVDPVTGDLGSGDPGSTIPQPSQDPLKTLSVEGVGSGTRSMDHGSSEATPDYPTLHQDIDSSEDDGRDQMVPPVDTGTVIELAGLIAEREGVSQSEAWRMARERLEGGRHE